MKSVAIMSPSGFEVDQFRDAEKMVDVMKVNGRVGEITVSDGYHTFEELYEHRIALFMALCEAFKHIDEEWGSEGREVWKSKLHSDGTSFEGWFILGIGKEKGEQMTYHLPNREWDNACGRILEKAPEWDGHTPADVLERLKNL